MSPPPEPTIPTSSTETYSSISDSTLRVTNAGNPSVKRSIRKNHRIVQNRANRLHATPTVDGVRATVEVKLVAMNSMILVQDWLARTFRIGWRVMERISPPA